MRKKIVIAMSGGADSSVAAALLKEQGYELTGITMRLWRGDPKRGIEWHDRSCCRLDWARSTAGKLQIPFEVLNLEEAFEKEIIEDFCEEYLSGRTPNPCVRCNERIKFGLLYEMAMQRGADYLATGHYARVEYEEKSRGYLLKRPVDEAKDQTYFLYRLKQKQLGSILFPIGELTKKEVLTIAKRLEFPSAEARESQEICFATEEDYREFINERRPGAIRPGEFINTKGAVIGIHKGIPFYTIGQRRGLGISASKRLYVVGINLEKNQVVLSEEQDLFRRELIADQVNFISFERLEDRIPVLVKIRYKTPAAKAIIEPYGEDKVRVLFDEPQRAITPGQSVVFYSNDTLLGGGVIRAALPAIQM